MLGLSPATVAACTVAALAITTAIMPAVVNAKLGKDQTRLADSVSPVSQKVLMARAPGSTDGCLVMTERKLQSDGSYLVTGTNPAKDVYVITAKVGDAPVSAFLLECLPDASLPNQSLGRASNGNFVLEEFEVDVVTAENAGNPVQAKIAKAQADYSQKNYDITNLQSEQSAKTRKRQTKRGAGWAIDGNTKKDARKAMFVLDQPAPAGSTVESQEVREQVHAVLDYQKTKIVVCPDCQTQYNVIMFTEGTDLKCYKCGAALHVPEKLTHVAAEEYKQGKRTDDETRNAIVEGGTAPPRG